MKKSKKIGLSLNKKVVSEFQVNQLNGGSSNNFTLFCTVGCGGGGGPITQSPKCEAEMQ